MLVIILVDIINGKFDRLFAKHILHANIVYLKASVIYYVDMEIYNIVAYATSAIQKNVHNSQTQPPN